MPDQETTINWISIYGSRPCETEDELVSRFRSLEDISVPQGFKNRIIDIDTEDPTESELYFGESGPDTPDERSSNMMTVQSFSVDDDEAEETESDESADQEDDEEEQVTREEGEEDSEAQEEEEDSPEAVQWMRATFDGEYLDELQTISNEVIAKIEPVQLQSFSMSLMMEGTLQEFDLPIDWDDDHEVTGVKFQKNGIELLIQTYPNSGRVSVRFREEADEDLTPESSGEFVEERVSQMEDTLEELKQ